MVVVICRLDCEQFVLWCRSNINFTSLALTSYHQV